MASTLPIINSISEISRKKLKQIMDIGFCHVELPDAEQMENVLHNLKSKALNFFRQSSENKIKLSLNEDFEGYANRQDGKHPQSIQQFFFRPSKPYGPFEADRELISRVTEVFQNQIGLPLIKHVFEEADQGEKFAELTQKPFGSFSFIYYPPNPDKKCKHGLTAHKDFDYITVLWITRPGLQVLYKGRWVNVNPKRGYVVVNFANALELTLGGICTSALHRVLLPMEERLSIGLFISPDTGPNCEKPLIDLMSKKELFPTYAQYIQSQFNQQY